MPAMKAGNIKTGPRLRITLDRNVAIGPGKADILEGVAETGSIAAAGRRMGMGYRKAWFLVKTMNECFKTPLVNAKKGGEKGGGAALTPLGEEVLRRYRNMERLATEAAVSDMEALKALLAKKPKKNS